MKYAVISINGKQYMVSEGDTLKLDRVSDVNIDVLLFSSEGNIMLGEPNLDNIEVKTTVIEDKLDAKVDTSRFRSKSRYRRKRSHRQPISVVKIDSIEVKTGSKADTKQSTKKSAKTSTETKKSTKTTKLKKETK